MYYNGPFSKSAKWQARKAARGGHGHKTYLNSLR